VSFIYGETDTIMPPHQGQALSLLGNAQLPCTVIPGAFHDPMALHQDFCRAVLEVHICNIKGYGNSICTQLADRL
jgi:pimeloyl-ACP methyl ester carboxylesterase